MFAGRRTKVALTVKRFGRGSPSRMPTDLVCHDREKRKVPDAEPICNGMNENAVLQEAKCVSARRLNAHMAMRMPQWMQMSNDASAIVIVHLAHYEIPSEWMGAYITKKQRVCNLYVCLCVCLCVCACTCVCTCARSWERAREREGRATHNCVEVTTIFFNNNKRQTPFSVSMRGTINYVCIYATNADARTHARTHERTALCKDLTGTARCGKG